MTKKWRSKKIRDEISWEKSFTDKERVEPGNIKCKKTLENKIQKKSASNDSPKKNLDF